MSLSIEYLVRTKPASCFAMDHPGRFLCPSYLEKTRKPFGVPWVPLTTEG